MYEPMKGVNNPNYKNGKTNNNTCIDCNVHISWGSTRCNRCGKIKVYKDKPELRINLRKISVLSKKGKEHPSYKEGFYTDNPKKCTECNKTVGPTEIYCLSCSKKGKRHWNWRGGISKEQRSSEFTVELKNCVRKRDNYICSLCGISELEYGKKLSVHHIDYDKQNCEEENLICLCKSCHTKTNTNRKYWTIYFQERMLLNVL